jgi:hypothetical protein
LRKFFLGIVAIVFVLMMTNPVHANGAFDQWGYNRKALIFKGWYVNAYAENQGFAAPYVGIKGNPCGKINEYFSLGVTCDPTTGWPSDPNKFWYAYNILLEINVNKAWDEARHDAAPWTHNAWLTNHQTGWYVGEDGKIHQWEWFLKIVWIGSGGSGSKYWRPGGKIWEFYGMSEFELIQSVYNDPYGGAHGVERLAKPAGLG